MAQPSSEGEILSLTSIRGIAAFWVVVFHFWSVVLMVAPEAAVLSPLVVAGRFAVPLFFVLSGYVLGLRYLAKLGSPSVASVTKFWWLRLGRIYPVHAFTLAMSLVLVARKGWPTDDGHSVGSFIANCFLVQAWEYSFRMTWNYPAWSISSEWFAYLTFPVVAFSLVRASRRMTAWVLVFSAATSAGVYALEDHLIFAGLAVVVPTFIGGIALAVVFPPQANALRRWPWAEILLLSIAGLPFLIAAGWYQSALLLALFFALVAVLGYDGHHSHQFWRWGPLVFLGEISYSLYMTHGLSIAVLTFFARFASWEELAGLGMFMRLGLVVGSLGVILVAATAVYYGVEQPMRNLSRRMLAPAKKAAAPRPIMRAGIAATQTVE